MCNCLHLLRCTLISDARMYYSVGKGKGKTERIRRIDGKKMMK